MPIVQLHEVKKINCWLVKTIPRVFSKMATGVISSIQGIQKWNYKDKLGCHFWIWHMVVVLNGFPNLCFKSYRVVRPIRWACNYSEIFFVFQKIYLILSHPNCSKQYLILLFKTACIGCFSKNERIKKILVSAIIRWESNKMYIYLLVPFSCHLSHQLPNRYKNLSCKNNR